MTPRPLRISLVVNSLGVGGVERQMLTLARHLDRRRFDAELVPLKSQGALAEDARSASVPMWTPDSRRGLDLAAAWRLAAHWRRTGVHTVLAANSYASIVAWLASRVMRRPPRLLSAFHSAPEHIGDGRRSRLQLALYGVALRGYDGLVFVSGLQRAAWAARGFAAGVPSTHVFNGIDLESMAAHGAGEAAVRSQFGWDASHFVVGVCASLRPEKRIEDLIRAVGLLAARGVPVRLLVIGDGTQRQRLEQAAAQSLAPGTAAFIGFRPDVASWIALCDVMALVSDAEAFSISVLESMACGKPMVLTRVGGAAEQIEDGVHGHLVERRSPEQIAQRIEQLWRSGEAAAMGARARERVRERFSLDAMVRGYEALLEAQPWPAAARTGAAPRPQAREHTS